MCGFPASTTPARAQRPYAPAPLFAVVAALLLTCCAAHGAVILVEFDEVDLPNGTLLDTNPAFAPYGLAFADETFYTIDGRLDDPPGAGTDDRGITTGGSNNVGEVIFVVPVTEVTFDTLRVSTLFTATVFDAVGTQLDTVTFPSTGTGPGYASHTFSGLGEISRLRFNDNRSFIAIGRLEYDQVPEPGAAGVLLSGLALCGLRRRRRARTGSET